MEKIINFLVKHYYKMSNLKLVFNEKPYDDQYEYYDKLGDTDNDLFIETFREECYDEMEVWYDRLYLSKVLIFFSLFVTILTMGTPYFYLLSLFVVFLFIYSFVSIKKLKGIVYSLKLFEGLTKN